MVEILSMLGLNLPYLVAGFSGGFVTLTFVRMPRGRAVLTVPAGALCANYLTAVVEWQFKVPTSVDLGCAFVVGIIAIKLVRKIYKQGAEAIPMVQDADDYQPSEEPTK